MHGLGRIFRTALVSVAALTLAGVGRAQFAPRFVKLDGVPAKAGAARANWTQMPNGAWTVRCYSGVLRQDGLRWTVVPPPGPAFVVQLAGFEGGLLAAGADSCWLLRGESWQRLFERREITSVLADGDVVLVAADERLQRPVHRAAEP